MNRATRLALLLTLIGVSFAVAWDFTPRSSGRTSNGEKSKFKGVPSLEAALAGNNLNVPVPAPTVDPFERGEDDDGDPDLPPGMSGKVDKEAYLRARGDYFNMLRGRDGEVPTDAREKAIRQMEKQERLMKASGRTGINSPAVDTTNWAFVGPNPIPLGQTQGTRVPVSGRTISIAIHPTDPDTVYVGTAQGGLYKTTNGGANWTKLFEFQLETLAIGAITIDPTDSSIVYVGTGENGQSADSFAGKGLYIIRNANSASPTLNGPFRLNGVGADVLSGRSIGRVLVVPSNNNILFVCTSTGSGGNPNTSTLNPAPRGVYRSTNAQSATPTFEQVAITGLAVQDRTVIDMEMDPANSNLMLVTVVGSTTGAGGDGGIYRTANALDPAPTFTRTLTILNATASSGRAELTVTRNSVPATTFYVASGEQSTAATGGPACSTAQGGVVRRSTDGGLTWSLPSAMANATGFCGGQCFYDIAIAVTPDNQTIHLGGAAGNSAAACGANVMKRSLNGGTTWASNNTTLHADEHALAIAPSNPQIVYTGSDGGIWRSTNNGTTWQTLNNVDFSATQFQGVAVHPFDRNFMMGGTQDNGTICWSAAGTVSHCRDGDGGYAVIDDNAQDTFNVLMYHTFFNQTNNQIGFERATNTLANADGQLSGWTFRGCSGTTSNNGFRCADNTLFYAPMNQGPGSPVNTLYFGTDRLYRSTNRGDTMTLVSQGPLVPSTPAGSGIVVTSIGISPQDDNVRLVGMRNGQVFATTTGSAVMTDVTGANFPPPNPLDLTRNSIGETVIDPNNKFTAYISFTSFSPPAGQQIFKTTNLNDPTPTWTPSSNGIPQVPISSIAVDPQDSNSLYAGTDIGVYHSSDGGANWSPLGSGLPRVAVFDVKISNVQRYLRIATHGRGIWEIGIPGRQLPVTRSAGATIVAEGCIPGNGVIDPSEDVTVSFGVTNIGPGQTNDLVVTLLATGGVTFPTGPVNYGVVGPGATVAKNFSFSNSASCGDTITLTFHLQDGALDLGNFSIPFTLGVLANSPATFTENFDGVTVPALPAGWTTAKTPPTGNPPLLVTSTTNHTPPNSAFGAGSTTAGENSLTSPTIAVPAAPVGGSNPGVRMTFRNSYNTEPDFDGAVLEISINGGPFQDILAAGGSFIEGGYNSAIVVTDNVITGRPAWTGNSGGFIITTVVLPPASYSQNAQLRWRTAYDSGTNPTGGGQRIDTISIYPSTRFCCGGACVLTCPSDITQNNDPGLCGATVTYPDATKSGSCSVNPVTSSHPSGSFFPVGTTNVVITDTKLDGSAATCDFDVTINDIEFPVVGTATATPNSLWPPNHQMENVTVNYTVTDNCPVNCVLTVASNEPINGMGDGDTAPDWVIVDANHVQLRAERSGKGNGRIYTITVTCTDASGHATTKTTTVTVPKNQKKGNQSVIVVNSKLINFEAAGLPAQTSSPVAAAASTETLGPLFLGSVNFDFSAKPAASPAAREESLVNLMLGSLEFKARNYDFRELSGARTNFKGAGSINGAAGYRYLLTVVDGQAAGGGGVDKFRIKIWNDKTGEVVYDNQKGDADDAEPTTPVGDGKSISFPK
jgi:photosystem II stability/assembly factor-like uncharacterized protein